jgi:ectoine hydroxylase-related dioxygenase (phytanoyl-CoA dioxygenase family)
VIPGSHRRGPFELTGGLEDYVMQHEAGAIDCVVGEGSVMFHYPTVVHASAKNTQPGTHRRVTAHRVRRSALRIPDWHWPPDLSGPTMRVVAQDGFDLNPLASSCRVS